MAANGDLSVSIPINLDPSGVDPGAQVVIAALNRVKDVGLQVGQETAQGIKQIGTAADPVASVIGDLRKQLADLGTQASNFKATLPNTAALSAPFKDLQDRVTKLGQTFDDTGHISQRAIASLGLDLKTLENQYGKNVAAVNSLSAAERAAFSNAKTVYAEAIRNQRAYNDELQKVNRATHDFTSLQGALEGLGGPLGNIAKVTGGVFAALSSGIAIGHQLDQWLTQNVTGWQNWKDRAIDAILNVYRVLDDKTRGRGTQTDLNALLTPLTGRGAGLLAKTQAEQALSSQGIQTVAAASADVKTFEENLKRLQVTGDGVGNFLDQNRSKVQAWAAAFVRAGQEVPASIANALQQLKGADAAVTFAKSETEAVKAKQSIENQFTELQTFIGALELRFKPPTTDPITKAVQDAKNTTDQALKDIGQRASAIQQSVDVDLAKFKELGAQIAQINAAGQQGPDVRAQIIDLQQQRAEILQKVTAERQNLDTLKAEANTVRTELAPAFEEIARRNALAEAIRAAQKEAAALSAQITDIANKASGALADLKLPAGTATNFQAQVTNAQLGTLNTIQSIPLVLSPEARKDIEDAALELQKDTTQGIVDGAKIFADRYKAAADSAAHALDEFGHNFGDLIQGAIEGGAVGFADVASKLFLKGVNEGAGSLGKLFAGVVGQAFGAAPDKNDPRFQGEGGSARLQEAQLTAIKQQETITNVLNTAVAGIGETLKIFQNAKQGQAPSILGTTVSFAAAGASFGWIGAAVGAVVGAVIGIFASAAAKANQLYASYGVREGQAFIEPNARKPGNILNITQQQQQDMLDQITTTIQDTNNGYIKLLGKLGVDLNSALIDGITHANFQPTLDASKTSIKNFMADFADWVNTTLPREISAKYRQPLEAGFETLGLSAARFEEIWNSLKNADPKNVVKDFNDLADALTAINKVVGDLSPNQYGITVGVLSGARQDAAKEFADQLAQADVALVQMGDTMSHLFGEEQIAAAKEWGDALTQREASVKQFFQQIAQAIDNVIAGYQGKIRDLTLAGFKTPEGAPDVGAQVNYLKEYADKLYKQIAQATTPEQVTQLSDELSKTITQIQQIGGSQSAEAAEAYRKWAIEQLGRAQDLVVDQLNKLAQDVASQNAAFLDAIQGFIDAFEHATDELNGTTTGTTGGTGDGSRPPPGPGPPLPPGSGSSGGGVVERFPNSKYDPTTGRTSGPGGGDYGDFPFQPYDSADSGYRPPSTDQRSEAAGAYYVPPPQAATADQIEQRNQGLLLIRSLEASSSQGVVSTKLLERIAANQERIAANQERTLAVLEAGRDVRVAVSGGVDMIFADGSTAPVALVQDDGGFDRRTVGSVGRR